MEGNLPLWDPDTSLLFVRTNSLQKILSRGFKDHFYKKKGGGETFKKGVFQGQFSYRRSSKEGFSLSNLFEEGGRRRGDRSKKRVVLVIILIFSREILSIY